MITNERIKSILFKDLKKSPVLGAISITKDIHAPQESAKERIVIVIPGGIDISQIGRAVVGINIFVPDIKVSYEGNKTYLTPNSTRFEVLEKECLRMFLSLVYGEFEDERYWYKIDQIITENDEATESHFLNVRILFEIANFKL